MNRDDPASVKEARKNLRRLLPSARRMAANGQGSELDARTPMSRQLEGRLRVKNILGVTIYEAESGGWHADVVLKKVPTGAPDSLGTPTADPCRSRAEAEAYATSLLAAIVAGERRAPDRSEKNASEQDEAWFDLAGLHIAVPRPVLEALHALAEADPREPTEIRARLDELLEETGVATDGRTLDDLPETERRRLISVLIIALHKRIFRHPPPEPRSPTHHAAHTTPQ